MMNLEPLSLDVIEQSMRQIVESYRTSTILTLIGGDILIGDVWYLDSPVLSPTPLLFNASNGETSGHKRLVEVDWRYISGIGPLPWTRETIATSLVKAIPNPLATLIEDANVRVYGGASRVKGPREYSLP